MFYVYSFLLEYYILKGKDHTFPFFIYLSMFIIWA